MTPVPRDLDGRRRWWARIALLVFVVAVAVIVFWPSPPARGAQEGLGALLERLHTRGLPRWISFAAIESLSNVVMFVPIGLFGALSLARRRWLVVLAAAAASGLVELTQQVVLPDRFADPRDVVANTGGAAIGLLLAWIWDVRRAHRDRTGLVRTGRSTPRRPEPAPAADRRG